MGLVVVDVEVHLGIYQLIHAIMGARKNILGLEKYAIMMIASAKIWIARIVTTTFIRVMIALTNAMDASIKFFVINFDFLCF